MRRQIVFVFYLIFSFYSYSNEPVEKSIYPPHGEWSKADYFSQSIFPYDGNIVDLVEKYGEADNYYIENINEYCSRKHFVYDNFCEFVFFEKSNESAWLAKFIINIDYFNSNYFILTKENIINFFGTNY